MKKLSIILILFVITSCSGNDPLFTDLVEEQLSVVFKATYESNDPRPFFDGCPTTPDFLRDNSVQNVLKNTNNAHEEVASPPSVFYVDLAEIRMNDDRFVNDRKYRKAKLNDTDILFNGTGISLKCKDLAPNFTYDIVQLYFRKLMFDNAGRYDFEWNYLGPVKGVFGVDEVDGYDLLSRMSRASTDKETYDDNRIFPLEVKLAKGFNFNRDNEYIIEIRVMVKNYIKRYEYVTTDVYENNVSYFGLSDQIMPVEPIVSDTNYIGGNAVGIARIYRKGKTATVRGTAPKNRFVVAVYEKDIITDFIKTSTIPPLATWCADGTWVIKDVEVGNSYKFYVSTDTPSVKDGKLPAGFTSEKVLTLEETDINQEISLDL